MKKNRIEEIAKEYDLSEDFDYYNTKFATDIILPYCRGKNVLEVGCATGEMTRELAKVCAELSVVEPSQRYCELLKSDQLNVTVYNCFFEDLILDSKFEVIILSSLLHHIKEPIAFLQLVGERLQIDGLVLATVPNMSSLHRRIGVKAKMLDNITSDTPRNIRFKQYGRFMKETFVATFKRSGFKVHDCFGYMLKPFSSNQMMRLNLSMNVYQALFEIGREFEELSSQLFLRASKFR